MPNAGDKLRAADISILSDTVTLPEGETPSAEQTWTDWGDPITFDNPGIPVTVIAWGSGSATNDDNASGVSMRVSISLDGGATWDDGQGPRDQAAGGTATRRGTVVGQHRVSTSSVPTGDIQIRAQIHATVISNGWPDFYFGSLTAMVVPNA